MDDDGVDGDLICRMVAPDGENFYIRRQGIPKKEGGQGVNWICSCGFYARMTMACGHLRALFNGRVTEDADEFRNTRAHIPFTRHSPIQRPPHYIQPYVELTPLGVELLRERWAILALRKA